MRTYKEPKRIDKARSREPGLVTIDEGISKFSALSSQVEDESMESSSDKEEGIVDEDVDSGVQENHIDDDEPEIEGNSMKENVDSKCKDDISENEELVPAETIEKKKVLSKKSRKPIENDKDHNEESVSINKNEADAEKNKTEVHSKSKKANIAKVPKKRKLVNEKKEKNLGNKDLINNCVVDLGNKEKISPKDKSATKEKTSPKSKNKLKTTKAKRKSSQLEEVDEESHKDESEKSSINTSDSLTVSPRSSKRTPIKNRKYQSDEELDLSKEETDSSGKKKRSRSKSPRCSTPKKRKLDFDEFMSIKDDDFAIEKDSELVSNESNFSKAKKVVKSPKNKIGGKPDLILKPKAVKKKSKILQNESGSLEDVKNEISEKINDTEKSNEENMQNEETSEIQELLSVEEKKKKVRKKKTEMKPEISESAKSTIDETLEEVINRYKSADDLLSDDENVSKIENETISKNEKETDNKHDEDDNKKESLKMEETNTEKNTLEDSEKGEKKEKRKMKPLEEIICVYCKKVSVGKAANTRHLKKCFVYQAKLEMQKQASDNGDVNEMYIQDDVSDNKDIDKSNEEGKNESNTQDKSEIEEKLNDSEQTIAEMENEDKENLDESASSENKSENQSFSRKKSKPDVIYNCQHCDYTASKRAMLARHLHSHSIYMCLRCSFFCESDDDLKDHMHREHKDRMDHKLCRKCSRYVHCVDITLEQHMENCQGPVPFKCPHCEKEFKYESSLKSHVVKHDPDGPKKFSCPQCSYKSNYKANLKKHLINIHSSRVKQFKCTYENCEKMFHSEDNMRRHLKWHRIEKPYKCKQCGKDFRTAGALTGHNVVHNSTKPFKCTMEDCEKSFRSQKLLKNHLQDFHNQAEKKFTCEHPGCDFAFFKRSHLDRHLVTHSGERKYGCSYCGKGFRHADNLRVHLRQHTNEKPVSCNMCDFRCRQKSSLRYHLQKVHNVVFKKREKRTNDTFPNNSALKLEMDSTANSVDTSMELITAIVNAVAKCSDSSQNEEVKDIEETSETICANDIAKTNSPVTNKVVDLYEFKSDDEFGDDSVMVPLPLPVQRPMNHVTSSKSNEKVETEKEAEKESTVKDDEPTDTELNETTEKPKPKIVRRGKKKKINYAEPETDISFETVEAKEENKEKVKDEKPIIKRKRGPRKSKLNAVKKMEETKEKKEPENAEVVVKGRRGRKKIEKIPKKRGRKPKNLIVEEKKSPVTSPPKKKKAGRPRKIRPSLESNDEKKEENKSVQSEEEENDSDKDEDRTIPGLREIEEEEDTLDNPVISPPTDDDDDTREYTGDENLKENVHELPQKEEEKSDKEIEENENKQVEEEAQLENEANNVEKQSEIESDKMSSGIDTDFEDDLKPPPAPRPPPVVDSDEADIESGPDDMDTPGRDFESTPPKSNLTEHIHSVPAHTPRDFESSPPKSVQMSDYGPSAQSQTGFETRREGDSVEALSGSYNATPSREVSIEEKRDEPDLSLPYIESENLPNTHQSPMMESIQPGGQSVGNADYGSQSESTMPEVDKEYLGQYLQQFDSASRSEDDRIERMNSQNEEPSEQLNLPTSPQKDLPPLNLSANAPPLNLSTSSNDRENSQGSDMSNKRMEILSMDRQSEEHYSGRSESVSRSSDRIPDNVYDSINSMNTFLPPSTRDSSIIHSSDSPFPSVSTPSTFMRFSENEALLQRQRMTTPFLPQGDPNALQNLHRMADNALAQHNNASLLRRPTTVPPREDMFSSSSAAMAQTIARNPFHNSWASQEVRPAHWGQSPYLGRTIDRPSAATSTSLFGKDNYLAGREFMFDTSRRAVTDRNVFPGLPQTQRPEIPHDAFSMERFDIGSYFGGHTYPGSSSLTDYNRAAAAHTSQKTFDERYRQSSTGITDFRALPQTTASSMFSSNMLNSSFHLDKYMYSRDPMYAQHIPDAANSPFLPGVPGQHSVFDREYTRNYFQNSPYSLDKQYAAAAAASAKLTHPSGASVVQDREFVPRPGTAAATGDNQVQDAYRHPMLYNMMNHRFYE